MGISDDFDAPDGGYPLAINVVHILQSQRMKEPLSFGRFSLPSEVLGRAWPILLNMAGSHWLLREF